MKIMPVIGTRPEAIKLATVIKELERQPEEFDEYRNNRWGTDFEFKAGAISGLALGSDVGPRFEIRLEGYSFESKTGDSYRWGWESSLGVRER